MLDCMRCLHTAPTTFLSRCAHVRLPMQSMRWAHTAQSRHNSPHPSRTQSWRKRSANTRERRRLPALQRWRWLFVICIGIAVACLSMLLNLSIAGLNLVKIKATERAIGGSGEVPG